MLHRTPSGAKKRIRQRQEQKFLFNLNFLWFFGVLIKFLIKFSFLIEFYLNFQFLIQKHSDSSYFFHDFFISVMIFSKEVSMIFLDGWNQYHQRIVLITRYHLLIIIVVIIVHWWMLVIISRFYLMNYRLIQTSCK